MPLPNILEFIGTNISQRKFQEAQEKLLNYLGIEVPTKTELNSEISKLNNAIAPKADQTYVNSALAGLTTEASKFYPTLAEANADIANIGIKDPVSIGEVVNGGLWYKATARATNLTKSPYDPLTQAKADATTKANAAEANAKTYADTNKLAISQVRTDYIGGNKIGPKTPVTLNSGINSSSVIVSVNNYDLLKLQVTEGQVLRVHNQEGNYSAAQGSMFKFFATGAIGEVGLADNRVLKTDITTGKTYYEVTVPAGATYLVLNKRFTSSTPTTYNYTWGVYSTDAFSFDYTAGKEIVVSVNGTGFKENTLASTNDWDLFVADGVIKGYVNSSTSASLAGASDDWRVFKMDVKEGVTYYLKLKPLSFLYPFRMIYSKSTTASSIAADFVSNVGYVATNIPDVYRFTVPKGSGIKSMIMNIKIDTSSYTLNIVDTLSIQEGGFDENKVGVKRKSVSSINGNSIKDEFAREGLAPIANKLESRFLSKKVFCFGDSITQGTEGGYVKYLSSTLGCDLSNFGSSGATAKRLVDIVVAGSGIPRRDTTNTEWAVKDYTQCSAITLQIGTNDFHSGAISDIPTTDLSSYADPLEYWALFPSNYVANIALCIEYIKSKNPECEIFLITPPYRNKEGDTPSRMGAVLPFLKAVSEYYSVPLINSMQESGIGFRYMKGGVLYSYDGIHFNELGNKLWGKCIAQKMLSIS